MMRQLMGEDNVMLEEVENMTQEQRMQVIHDIVTKKASYKSAVQAVADNLKASELERHRAITVSKICRFSLPLYHDLTQSLLQGVSESDKKAEADV
jgi:hypothetical protein